MSIPRTRHSARIKRSAHRITLSAVVIFVFCPGVGATELMGARASRSIGGPVSTLHAKVRQRPDHPNTYQDGLAVHAGGAYTGQIDSIVGHGERPHAECRDGRCGDHCVVRPDRFGFYGTQWRTWPGTMVVQTAGVEELTPASPPRSELPTVEQESLDPDAAVDFGVDDAIDDTESTTLPGLEPAPVPPPARQPERPEPAAEPKTPAPMDEPREKTPAPPSAVPPEENLFDEAARGLRLNERLAVIHARTRAAAVAPIQFPGAEEARPLAQEAAESPESKRVDPVSGHEDAPMRREDAPMQSVNPLRKSLRPARPYEPPADGR